MSSRRAQSRSAVLPTDFRGALNTHLVIPTTTQNALRAFVSASSAVLNGYGNKGDEIGGHFVAERAGSTVVLKGVASLALSMGHTSKGSVVTGVNVGDYPYTFHTHPKLFTLDAETVENYPDTLSAVDLVAAVNEAAWSNGHSVCDVLASPSGIQVYRARKPPETKRFLAWKTLEETFTSALNLRAHKWNQTSCFNPHASSTYIETLSRNGVDVVMRPWTEHLTPLVIDVENWVEVCGV